MDVMVSKIESVKEILKVFKFEISHIDDPLVASLECFIKNY